MTCGRATEDYGEIIAMDKFYERLKSLLENPGTVDGFFVEETKRLIEDLRLHQTELQAQNEELKTAHATLEEHKHRLADLYDHAPVAYLTFNAKGVIEEANLTASALLGVPVQKLVGTRFQQYVHPDCTDKYVRYLSRVALGTENVSCELRLRKHGGTFFWGRVEGVSVEPLEGEKATVRSAVIDITERKEAIDALQESEGKYRALVESVQGIIIRLDNEGRVVFLNDYGRDFFGYSPEELWAQGVVGTIVAREDAVGFNVTDLLASMAEHPERYWAREIDNTRRSGERVRVSWTIKTLRDEEGHFTGILALGNDVTGRRKLEERLRQSQKMEAIGTLAGGIAHDFNNLLAAVIGFTEMAADDVADRPPVQNYLKNVLRAAMRGRDLVRQILAFSREAGYARTPIAVSPLVTETIQFLRASIPVTIEIKLSIAASSDTVLAAPTEIQQILMNLATNASLAMEEKGGVLEISLADVDITPDSPVFAEDVKPGEYLQVMVRDTGTGMDPDVMKRVFEPFFTTRDIGTGTGMGLSVVYGIVNDLQGIITVESEPGMGSTFRVFLPKADTKPKEDQWVAQRVSTGTESILFVDDEDMIAAWGQGALERLGYRVTATTDPAEALNIFASDPSRFDLVITDQTMPSMSGMRLAKKLLKIRPEVPIILSTGYSATVSPEKAKEAGIKQLIMKPLARHELAQAIRRALGARKEE